MIPYRARSLDKNGVYCATAASAASAAVGSAWQVGSSTEYGSHVFGTYLYAACVGVWGGANGVNGCVGEGVYK